MSYRRQKFVLFSFLLTVMGFLSYGCSQEPERKTTGVEKALDKRRIELEKTKYDLIEEFPRAELVTRNTVFTTGIKKSRIMVNPTYVDPNNTGGEERDVILAYPPSEFRYHLSIPGKGFLEFSAGVIAESVDKNVKFEVYIDKDRIFSRHINPNNREEDTLWFDEKIDLSKYGGKKVSLSFKTVPGSQNQISTALIMAGWSNLRIIEATTVERNLSSKDRPNIILMVVDTLGANHLTPYGYKRDTSPALNKVAEKGVLFDKAISQSSWTWPATASILTGLYPYTHGVSSDEKSFLLDSVFTLPEILQGNHFTTLGLSASPLITKDKNFDQGFETFIEMPWSRAADLNNRFLKWLQVNKDFQFFAYLHYMDPHDPYSAPGEYYEIFDRDYKGTIRKGEDLSPLWKAINYNQGNADYTERDIEHLVALYDGEIRYWDHEFGDLMEQLKELNILANTVIVVTSDHGEEFWNMGD